MLTFCYYGPMTDMEDLDDLMEAGAYQRPRRHRARAALAPLIQPLLYRYHLAVARLRAIRPLPAEPLGELVIGHARLPIRQPIVLRDGQVWFTGQAINPFARRVDPSVRTYQVVGPDGVVVHEGPVDPMISQTVTTGSMSLAMTVRIQLRQEFRHGP